MTDQPVRHRADTITDNDLDALYARAERAEAALDAFHEGEEPQPDERAVATPAQWIWLWNRATLEQRLDVAARFVANGATAYECVLMNHKATVDELRHTRATVDRVRDELQRWMRNTLMPQTARALSDVLAALDEPKQPA